MENITLTHGLHAELRPWRPWLNKTSRGHKTVTHKPYERSSSAERHCKVSMITHTHPVKLFWPKSQCFDYLYQEAELLLQNYPVQATICIYEEDEDDDDDDDDEEKDLH